MRAMGPPPICVWLPCSRMSASSRISDFSRARSIWMRHGDHALVNAIRATLAAARVRREEGIDAEGAAALALGQLETEDLPRLKPVYNLTGTVLHTNLGRALIAQQAIEAAVAAMRNAVA